MASKQPAHGSSAQTTEFDIDLVAEGIRDHSGPHHAVAVVTVDANFTLRVEISAGNQYDWQLDARIVNGSLEVRDAFCEGDHVHEDDVPEWIKRVLDVVGKKLLGDVGA
ncbi:hypothetical protein [Halorubrum sp. F4]|uniref:hypothetical protein n=1 Tax=Halorubrum sp. F4 TaxID=2989715 RepID=UPI00247FADC9|nr:hypothetical protein [Halorubrum sp. F4]